VLIPRLIFNGLILGIVTHLEWAEECYAILASPMVVHMPFLLLATTSDHENTITSKIPASIATFVDQVHHFAA